MLKPISEERMMKLLIVHYILYIILNLTQNLQHMHYVFLIHGSSCPDDWFETTVQALKDNAKSAIPDQYDSAISTVEFVKLEYAKLLQDNLKTLIDGGLAIPKINDWLQLAQERADSGANLVDGPDPKGITANFLLEFIRDVISYNWNTEMIRYVLNHISTKVLDIVEQAQQNDRFSFIAHGVGCKVIFDLLQQLYGDHYRLNPDGSPSMGALSIANLYMIGNTAPLMSKLDAFHYNVDESHVRIHDPMAIPRQGGVVKHNFRIINHKYDLISQLGSGIAINPSVYSSKILLDDVTGIWMHSLLKYVNHPAVYCTFVEDFLLGKNQAIANKNDLIRTYSQDLAWQSKVKEVKEIFQHYGQDRDFDSSLSLFDFVKSTAETILEQV